MPKTPGSTVAAKKTTPVVVNKRYIYITYFYLNFDFYSLYAVHCCQLSCSENTLKMNLKIMQTIFLSSFFYCPLNLATHEATSRFGRFFKSLQISVRPNVDLKILRTVQDKL